MSADLMKRLYIKLLQSWNRKNARDFSSLFAEDGIAIGFDGSIMQGPDDIHSQLSKIFSDHEVATYISVIKDVQIIETDIWLLLASAGMVPPGGKTVKPEVNSIQTVIARQQGEDFKIVLLQNTPAALHGRSALREQMTAELQKAFDDATRKTG